MIHHFYVARWYNGETSVHFDDRKYHATRSSMARLEKVVLKKCKYSHVVPSICSEFFIGFSLFNVKLKE